jgi:HAD superfamily hydrolase (TIGR01549 family)
MVDTALLDVDGTLVDSNYWHVAAWQRAFAEVDRWQPSWLIHSCVGMGGDRLVAAVAGDQVEEQFGDAVRKRWKELYDELLANVRPLPGAADLVRELKRRGLKVVLASSGKPDHLEYARRLLDVDDLLDAVTTGDDVESTKPAGELFALALRRAGGRAGVVVGDTPWDAKAAAAVGLPMVGVRCGGFGTDALRNAGAAVVLNDPADVIEHIHHTPLV